MGGDDRSGDRPGGMREVFQRGDGSYYLESQPGAGPRHHDDTGVTPDDVERKAAAAAGYGPSVPDSPAGLGGPGGAAGAMLLVLGRDGGIVGTYRDTPDNRQLADRDARNAFGWVVSAPIVTDHHR